MKYLKTLLCLSVLFACLNSQAAVIHFTNTNSVGQPDTNAFRVIPISSPINADGSFIQTGIPIRLTPNASGIAITNLAAGNYVASNAFLVNQWYGTLGTGRGIAFAVPTGSGTYEYSALAISQGSPSAAFNVFNYNGQQFVATASNILYTLGVTNILDASTITNLIVGSSNAVSSVSNSSTNLLTILTNAGPNFALTVISQTNNFTSLVFTNPSSIVMTNFLPTLVSTSSLPTITNRFALTNQSTPVSFTNDANQFAGYLSGYALHPDLVSDPMQAFLGYTADGKFSITGSSLLLIGAFVSNSVTSGTATNALNVDAGITNRWKIDATNAVTGIATTNTYIAGSGLTFSTNGKPVTVSVTEGTTNRFALTNYVFNVSNNVVTASNALSVYVLGISNRYDVLFPTNSGTDGQLVTKSGTNVYWSTVTGGSGTGMQTNNGSGTNQILVDAVMRNTNIINGINNSIASTASPTNAGIWERHSAVLSGYGNAVDFAVLAGSHYSAVVGGFSNNLTGAYSFIGGGESNLINGSYSSILGGSSNRSAAAYTVLGGGRANTIGTASDYSAILSGRKNFIGVNGLDNLIVGGNSNSIDAGTSGFNNLIVGGSSNVIHSSSTTAYNSIFGGRSNVISGTGQDTFDSVAMGSRASVSNNHTFVWNDGSAAFWSVKSNTVLFGAANGIGINTNDPGGNALNAIGGGISATNFNVQGDPFIYWNTNTVSVRGAGSIALDGTYVYLGSRYTNYLTGSTITNNAGTWVMLNPSLQSAYSLAATQPVSTNWTLGVGSPPSPRTFFGGYFDIRGFYVLGDFDSTNLAKKYVHPTNAVAAGSLPVTVGTGGDTIWTNATSLFSSAGTVATARLATNTTVAGVRSNIVYASMNGCALDSNHNGSGTDDTIALQRLLNLATNAPLELVIDNGIAMVSSNGTPAGAISALTIYPNTTIRFLPNTGLYLKSNTFLSIIATQLNTNYATTNISIVGPGTIYMNSYGQTNSYRVGGSSNFVAGPPFIQALWLSGVQNVTIRDLTFINPVVSAICLQNARDVTIDNITVDGRRSDGGPVTLGFNGVCFWNNINNVFVTKWRGLFTPDDQFAFNTSECFSQVTNRTFNGATYAQHYSYQTNILVDGVTMESCVNLGKFYIHSSGSVVSNIVTQVSIKNVLGDLSNYGIGFDLTAPTVGDVALSDFEIVVPSSATTFKAIWPSIAAESLTARNMHFVFKAAQTDTTYPALFAAAQVNHLEASGIYSEYVDSGGNVANLFYVDPTTTNFTVNLSDITIRNGASIVYSQTDPCLGRVEVSGLASWGTGLVNVSVDAGGNFVNAWRGPVPVAGTSYDFAEFIPIYNVAATNVNWTSNNVYAGQILWQSARSTYFITNAAVTADSAVITSLQSVDATFTVPPVAVCSAGLITLTANANPSANTKVAWRLLGK